MRILVAAAFEAGSQYAHTINQLQHALVRWRRDLSPKLQIPDDLFAWRQCLGPEDAIARFRASYIKQYQRLLKLDETTCPGRVGACVEEYLKPDFLGKP